ncbi:MAG: ABC transporter substrate-binding protein [Solirubrobacteraceae bacterium]
MRNPIKLLGAIALSVVAAFGVSACGSSSSSSSGGKSGGTATALFGTAADSLDPQFGYTTQAAEPDWVVYTPLLTYRHASGTAGGELIPGLATGQPQISADGLTWTLTLRKGLTYSTGAPVKASDFAYTILRALKLNWGGKAFYTTYIKGAAEADKGKTKTISGIATDDATGKITIRLLKPYGAFGNVLAFPSSGLVPTGTPMTNQPNTPPPGDGPYMFGSVAPNKGYSLVQNPRFAAQSIPDIPKGHLKQINVQVVSTPQQEAQQVLNNTADSFDPADELPGSVLSQIQSQASDRYKPETTAQNYYFFLNTKSKPFSNQLAREAVNYALDRRAFVKQAAGALTPACFFLPPQVVGHPAGQCPYGGDPNGAPDLAKAKQLVQQSGMAGTALTVWGENVSPRKDYVDTYTSVLNQIGFKATEKLIARATYFNTIGNAKTPNVQTGFADWQQDFPNPSDFYLLMDGNAIQPVNNQNFSNVNDPHIQSELAALNKVPAGQLSTVAPRWQALDTYVASKAYQAVYGYNKSPMFLSKRLDFASAIFHPVYFDDYTSWKLK